MLVVAVAVGSPAAAAGLRAGWTVEAAGVRSSAKLLSLLEGNKQPTAVVMMPPAEVRPASKKGKGRKERLDKRKRKAKHTRPARTGHDNTAVFHEACRQVRLEY